MSLRARFAALPPVARATAALLLVFAAGLVWNGNGAFFQPGLHLDLVGSKGVIGLLAIGQCLVILTGGIDLSVGSVLALADMLFAGLMLRGGWPAPLALPAAVAAGALVGLANGVLVARLRVQPFLATLSTMVIARGLAMWIPVLAGQHASEKFVPDAGNPPFWDWYAGRLPGGLPVVGALLLATALAVGAWVRRTVAGRWLCAVGGNEEAARLSGIPVARVKELAYALCGALAGLAATAQTARDVQGNPGTGEMFELQAIAAVVIGGTHLRGGSGGVGLTLLGVLTIGYLDKIQSLNGVETHWRLVLQGAIILAAVLLQERRR
jgi:ribose transport system permease protein